MLRESMKERAGEVDFGAITDGRDAERTGVAHGAALIDLAESVIARDEDRLARARAALIASIGADGLVDAAAVAAFFDAIDRVADATGTQLTETMAADTVDLRRDLAIDDFETRRKALDQEV